MISAIVVSLPAAALGLSVTVNLSATPQSATIACPNCPLAFGTLGIASPFQITLSPGTYTLSPIDPSGGGSFTAWNYHNGSSGLWVTRYGYHSTSLGFVCVNVPNVNDCSTHTDYLTAQLAFAGAAPTTFSISQTELVSIFVYDANGALGDNVGGVSLKLVPEPSTAFLLISTLLSLPWLLSHRSERV
jgi:hypothetical protein